MRGRNGRWLTHPLLMARWPHREEDKGGKTGSRERKERGILIKSGFDVGRWRRKWGGRNRRKSYLMCHCSGRQVSLLVLQWDCMKPAGMETLCNIHVLVQLRMHTNIVCVCVFNSLINYPSACQRGNRIYSTCLPPLRRVVDTNDMCTQLKQRTKHLSLPFV